MAWSMEALRQTLDETKAKSHSAVWDAVREIAWTRLQQVGLPRPRSDAFFWIPLSLLQAVPVTASAKPQNSVEKSIADTWAIRLPQETDTLALLSAMLSPNPLLRELPSSPQWQEFVIENSGEYDLQEIRIPDGSKVRLQFSSSKSQSSISRYVLQIGKNCEVDVLDLQSQSDSANQLQHFQVSVEADTKVNWFSLDCGHKLFRTAIDAHLVGARAEFEFRALSILGGENQSHRRIRVWHSAPEVRSEQFIRHILLGQANASCDTQVEITRGTKGTKAHQLVNSLLLSPQARASAKPTLMIHNDEVEASHGTTCGDLDAGQLFYMQSRGLSIPQARQLLLNAFVESVVEGHPASTLRTALAMMVRDALSRRLV